MTGSIRTTFTASGAPACPLIKYVAGDGGVVWSDAGFNCATYHPPTLSISGTKVPTNTVSARASLSLTNPTSTGVRTTFSTLVVPSGSGPVSSIRPSISSNSTTAPSPPSATGQMTCNDQRRPNTGAPSADDIALALTKSNQIASICAAKFNGFGDSTHETFNHGQLTILVQRASDTAQLTHCTTGLSAIIDDCFKLDGVSGANIGKEGSSTRSTTSHTLQTLLLQVTIKALLRLHRPPHHHHHHRRHPRLNLHLHHRLHLLPLPK